MIIEVRNRTKNAKEIILQCDNCKTSFIKDYKTYLTKRKFHFCSVACSNEQKKNGGVLHQLIENTCLIKYGSKNVFQNESIKEKSKKTMIIKYGVENCSQHDAFKQIKKDTCMKNWGVEIPLRSEVVLNKFKTTMIKRYGQSNPSQVRQFFERAQNNMRGSNQTGHIIINDKSIFYRSSYEKIFLQSIINNDNKLLIKSNIPINYFFENKLRRYFADFLIIFENKSTLFEIKPISLINSKQNQAKFAAANKYINYNDIEQFIVLTENDLFCNHFNVEKFFTKD
jgi:hypothetical protein